MFEDTIVYAPFEADEQHRPMLYPSFDASGFDVDVGNDVSMRLFKIKAADTEKWRNSANGLIHRRYAWRGYQPALLSERDSVDGFTLVLFERRPRPGGEPDEPTAAYRHWGPGMVTRSADKD